MTTKDDIHDFVSRLKPDQVNELARKIAAKDAAAMMRKEVVRPLRQLFREIEEEYREGQ